ncbi:hypothetical protein EJ05DRAFT_476017 [Pseudovirgaria hyperparasitica]|uniref:Uncharacterized protein n=1 Tax=Pseudovirgaria hyperparasitica TaxID=470096 RepID=A0A6A6W9J8_9PEZI|nr:uncharacterized protein EJ05DRAFT_476017 [Pseudovirgaria hyperparasitica]KAF2758704.1 hypothetical protein EJ05DRAFT_476017 [Pseudovirgaria hyperparasitica]
MPTIDDYVTSALQARAALRYNKADEKALLNLRKALYRAHQLLNIAHDVTEATEDDLLQYHIELPWAYSSAVGNPAVPGDCAQMGADHYSALCQELYDAFSNPGKDTLVSDTAFGEKVIHITNNVANYTLVTADVVKRTGRKNAPRGQIAALAWACTNSMSKRGEKAVEDAEKLWVQRCGQFTKEEIV